MSKGKQRPEGMPLLNVEKAMRDMPVSQTPLLKERESVVSQVQPEEGKKHRSKHSYKKKKHTSIGKEDGMIDVTGQIDTSILDELLQELGEPVEGVRRVQTQDLSTRTLEDLLAELVEPLSVSKSQRVKSQKLQAKAMVL